jgi:transcriptional regulator with XRE-family HTH domain
MEKLRNWRLERGLSQHELAMASSVARWKIQLIEQGIQVPTYEELARLSEALGVDPKNLILGAGEAR